MTRITAYTGTTTETGYQKLQKENYTLMELLRDAFKEIEALKVRLTKYEKPGDGYNKAWTMVTKMVFLVTKADKPLLSSEILFLIHEKEPTIEMKQASLQKYLSAFLNTAVKHKRLIPYKLNGVRGYFYCLPEWISEGGELMNEMRRKIY